MYSQYSLVNIILTIGTEEAPLPVSVHTDVPHLTLGLGVGEEPLPGAAGEGGVGGGGEDGIVQARLTRHGLSQPVQRVVRVRVTSRVGLGLGPTTALWPRSGGGGSQNYHFILTNIPQNPPP